MPIYEYKCNQCGSITEIFLRSSDNEAACVCGQCHSPDIVKIISQTFVPKRGEFVESIVKKNESKKEQV